MAMAPTIPPAIAAVLDLRDFGEGGEVGPGVEGLGVVDVVVWVDEGCDQEIWVDWDR